MGSLSHNQSSTLVPILPNSLLTLKHLSVDIRLLRLDPPISPSSHPTPSIRTCDCCSIIHGTTLFQQVILLQRAVLETSSLASRLVGSEATFHRTLETLDVTVGRMSSSGEVKVPSRGFT